MKKDVNKIVLKEESIWKKIKNFLKRVFLKKDVLLSIPEVTQDYKKNKQKDDFDNRIKVIENKEEKRIMDLQQKLECNEISIDDISNVDFNQVMKLYQKQILDLKNSTNALKKSTEYYKIQLNKIKNKYK